MRVQCSYPRTNHRGSDRERAGITLTEILIAIMIMGVGMVSVATLFPIGILRLRDATRDARSTILAQSAMADADVRALSRALGDTKGLVNPDSFIHPNLRWYDLWRDPNNIPVALLTGYPFAKTPLTYDYDTIGNNREAGVFSDFFSPGLPVAYDPLFWATTHYATEGLTPEQTPLGLRGALGSEGRFGSEISLIQDGVGAHGLQRITNFAPYNRATVWPYTYTTPLVEADLEANAPMLLSNADVVGKVFTSLDDPVLIDDESGQSGSPVVPANFAVGGGYLSLRNYDFSWMLTGRLGMAGDPTNFEGEIVVFHKRPMGLDPDPATGALVPTGERVVEAIWGYTTTSGGVDLNAIPTPRYPQLNNSGYAFDDRTVLLRWSPGTADPLVRVGDFIADVTYERYSAVSSARYPRPDYVPDGNGGLIFVNGARYPGQRIHWYRVVSRSEREFNPALNSFQMTVRVDTPLKAKTRLEVVGDNAVPVVREAALICPYVVNVFPVLLYSR